MSAPEVPLVEPSDQTEAIVTRRLQTEHSGKFYFRRAFWTIFGGLLGWSLWALLPILLLLVLWAVFGSIGALLPGNDAIPSDPLPSDWPTEPVPTGVCDPASSEPC